MKRLTIKPLSAKTIKHLSTKQTDINGKLNFLAKAERAEKLWKGKNGSKTGKEAFDEIKSTLVKMCVGVEGCNYCEGNEARDIEHIYPKSLFPERAFQWSNYLLACKTCNTGEKLDGFAIFNPVGSLIKFDIPRATEPLNKDTILIDPRLEDPEDYLWLDIQGGTFKFRALPNISSRDAIRAEYTIRLLSLNDRENLVEARRAAANHFQNELKRYISVKATNDFNELDNYVHDPELIDSTIPFVVEKARIMTSIKKNILTYAHPTVWLELKRQRASLPKTGPLFNQAQEALTW